MVCCIDPTWTVEDTTPVESGYSEVYRLRIRGGDPASTVYLKATAVEGDPGVGTDARLCRYLERRSTIPVPSVYGVVDGHTRSGRRST
ncbi:MAG: hypothetical protein ACLFMX_00390 [Halobacteriales archaeon]